MGMTPRGQVFGLLEIWIGEESKWQQNVVVKCGLWHWTAWVQALAVCPWGSHLTSLCLSLPTVK